MYDAFVAYHARAKPRALALITPQKRATYAEFDADVNRYAAGFLALGVTPDRGVVSVETSQSYRRHVMLLALARLAVASGVTRDTRVDLKISDRPGEARPGILRLSRDWIAATEMSPPVEVASAPRDPDGLCRVLLSSGTTRTPRRIPTTWRRRMDSNMNALAAFAAGRLGVWAILPGIDSGLGNSLTVLAWTIGAAVAADFPLRDLPRLMERHPEGLMGLTPMHLRDLISVLPDGFELKPQWRVVSTGAALSPTIARAARTRLTPDVVVSYSATESGRAAVGPAALLEIHPGAVGWPAPGAQIEVVGPDGARVPDGEQGEIRVRSERSGRTYVDDPNATASVFREGWVYPGDLGRRLPNGSFVIDGRADERMNIGGVKVLPNVFETALLEHPNVRDAAAFAVPDAYGQDACWIAVIPDGEVSREELMRHLKAAGMPVPAIHFAWAATIPRNEMGKIDREALRAQTMAALGKDP